VAEASARVRVVVAELRADGAEELEQHLRAALLAALSPDAGGSDEAAYSSSRGAPSTMGSSGFIGASRVGRERREQRRA